MPAPVLSRHRRDILDSVAGSSSPAAEIHVLEPDGEKVFIEAPQPLPNVSPEHEESPGRLLHRAAAVQIPVQAAITPVNGI
jgi:hypothetical protein